MGLIRRIFGNGVAKVINFFIGDSKSGLKEYLGSVFFWETAIFLESYAEEAGVLHLLNYYYYY
jgi:hypothetical protein